MIRSILYCDGGFHLSISFHFFILRKSKRSAFLNIKFRNYFKYTVKIVRQSTIIYVYWESWKENNDLVSDRVEDQRFIKIEQRFRLISILVLQYISLSGWVQLEYNIRHAIAVLIKWLFDPVAMKKTFVFTSLHLKLDLHTPLLDLSV